MQTKYKASVCLLYDLTNETFHYTKTVKAIPAGLKWETRSRSCS